MAQSFSIIIPTRNRPGALASCLEALTGLLWDKAHFEVIVVDDASDDPLDAVVSPFASRLPLHLLRVERGGPAAARNRGARLAQGDFLAFTDDDCLPTPGWLNALASTFTEHPEAGVGGRTLNRLVDNTFSSASQLLISFLYDYHNRDSQDARLLTSNNLAFPAACFRQLGGFDTGYTLAASEDREICARWRHRGFDLLYRPEALVYHAHPLAPRSFWRQHFNYGRGAYQFHQARRHYEQTRVRIEPLTFYTDLLAYPFRSYSPLRALMLSALLFLSQLAHTAGYLWQRQQSRAQAC